MSVPFQSSRNSADWSILGCLAGIKIVYIALIVIGTSFWSNFDTLEYFRVNARWPREGNPTYASHFATWDSAHYLALSETGYHKNSPSCAFYPLWPLSIRLFSVFTGCSHLISGLILSNVISLFSYMLFYVNTKEKYGDKTARLSLLFLIVFPGSLFHQFIYSESMFFFLSIVLWSSLLKEKYYLAFIAAFLLPITRAIGLLCAFPIAWHLISHKPNKYLNRMIHNIPWINSHLVEKETHKLDELQKENCLSKCAPHASKRQSNLWWLLCAPFAGWSVYLAFMIINTGNAFEGFDAQKYWGVHSIANLIDIKKFIYGLFDPTSWHSFEGSLLDRFAFILLLYGLFPLWKTGKELFIWACVLGLVPAMSGTFTSFTRFESVVFPLFIVLGVVLSKPGWRFARWGLLGLFVILHVVLVWRFVNFRWAG